MKDMLTHIQHVRSQLRALIHRCFIITLVLFVILPAIASGFTTSPDKQTELKPRQNETPWINSQHAKDENTLIIAMHHDMPPLSFINLEGRPVGLLVDIWQRWSEKTDTKIQFLPSPWIDTLNNLATGKAHIHAGLFYSESRASHLAFSQAYYESDASIFFPVNTSRINSMEDLSGQKVGAVKKTFHEAYLRNNYPDIEVIPFKTTKLMVDALENKDIRAFFAVPYLASRILSTLGLSGRFDRMDERHGRQKFRAGIPIGNNKLLELVDKGFSQITNEELIKIEERWIPNPEERVFSLHRQEIRFTLSEEHWLKKNPIWKVGVSVSQAPYLAAMESGKHTGIIIDYLNLISDRLGVIFHPISITASSYRPDGIDEKFLYLGLESPQQNPDRVFSIPLMPVPYVIVNRAESPFITSASDLNGKSVTAVKNTTAFNHLYSAFPNIDVVATENQREALQKTSSSKTYAALCDANIAGRLISTGLFANLKIAAPFQSPEVSLHFSNHSDSLVLSMLNKAIATITKEEHEAIRKKWTPPVRYEQGSNWKLIITWVTGISVFFLFILSVFFLWNHRLSREVTERKKIEAALKESEERYRGIFEFTRSGVIVFDAVENGADFIVTEFNRSAEEIEKIKKQDVIGKKLSTIFPGFAELGIMQQLQKVYISGSPLRLPPFQYRDKRISGWRDYFFYKLPTSEVVTVYSDETKRKEAEEEKERLINQLHQSRKMETIGTLAGGIAHDFNNILAIILGNLELSTIYTQNDELIGKRIKEAHRACLRAKEVIGQLLRFSRGTEEKMEVVRMDELLEESGQLIRSTFPSIIDVQFQLHADHAVILGNATQIQQILFNLCTNAAHAMESSGGTLTVQLNNITINDDTRFEDHTHELPPGPYLDLRIADTGEGMTAEVMERIFDPYFTTKDVGKGTGMGLAIAEGAVRAHNGKITVESTLNQGTTFRILLPVYEGEKPQKQSIFTTGVHHTGSERIFLIDDEPLIAQLGKDILESKGYTVKTATHPVTALELFEQKPDDFDLIITDMTMPEMTGDQLIARIMAVRPKMPIIICTGYSETMNLERAARIGAVDYVEKPLTVEQLTASVRKVLDLASRNSTS